MEDKYLFHFIQHMNKPAFFVSYVEEIDAEILRSNSFGLLLISVYFHKLDEFVNTTLKTLWLQSNNQTFVKTGLKKCWRYVCANISEIKKNIKSSRNLIYPKVLYNKVVSAYKTHYRVYYVRYINNVMFGVCGFKNLAICIKKEFSFFMVHNLFFDLKIAKLYNARTHEVSWLGFNFKVRSEKVLKNKNDLFFNKGKKKNLIDLRKYPLEFVLTYDMALRVNEILIGLAKTTV